MGFKSRPSSKRVYLTFEDGKSHKFWDVTPDTLEALRSSPIFDEIDFSWSYVSTGHDASPAGFNKAKDMHFGDLHVGGDLEQEENLTVLGSLRVDGVILQDTHVGLLVTGDQKARAFDVRGLTFVRGEFRGDYLQLSQSAYLHAAGGVKARLVVRDSYDAYIHCDFKAAHFLDATTLGKEEFLASLSNVLVPSAMEDSNKYFYGKKYFHPDVALALAGEGKPFLKSATTAMKNFPSIAPEY